MNIEIKNRFTGEIIISGKYESLKELVEKNSTYLRDADLRDADLVGADLVDAYLRDADLVDANLVGADLVGAYLRGADLVDADLVGADLVGANLRDADLRDADLGVKIPPINSHDFIVEILKREAGENIKYLKYIGIIILMREWCWEDFLEKLPKSFIKWAQKILCDKWPKDFNSCFGGDK